MHYVLEVNINVFIHFFNSHSKENYNSNGVKWIDDAKSQVDIYRLVLQLSIVEIIWKYQK